MDHLEHLQWSPKHRKIRREHEWYENMLTQSVEQADHVLGAVVAKKINESLEQHDVSMAG